MRTLLIGIDSGTQSTKVLVVDAKNGRVIAASAETYDLIPGLAPGAKEQHPHTWRDAMQKACAADMSKLCAGKEGRDAFMCLRENDDKLSGGCKAAREKMRSLRPPGSGGGGGGPGL